MNPEYHKPLPERLPRPSYAPPLLAVGLMFLVWGAVTTWIISATGILITTLGCLRWIGDLRGDILTDAVKRTPLRKE